VETNPLEGIDPDIMNEAVRYGMEFMEEAERRQMQAQAQAQAQGQQPQGPPQPGQQPPWMKHGKKHHR